MDIIDPYVAKSVTRTYVQFYDYENDVYLEPTLVDIFNDANGKLIYVAVNN